MIIGYKIHQTVFGINPVNYANQTLNIWLKPNNFMYLHRWLKPTAIVIIGSIAVCFSLRIKVSLQGL